jgi:DNA-binding NtrC family response regulator
MRALGEREVIMAALKAAHWNRRRAAELLEIEYKALLYRMRKLGISPERNRGSKPMGLAVTSDGSTSAVG